MALSDYRLEYTDPTGSRTVVFDPNAVDGPYMLMPTPTGLMNNLASGISRRGPGQRGSTLMDVKVGERTDALKVAVLGGSEDEYWERRFELARTLVVEPAGPGADAPVGILRAYRPGRPVLELEVIPEDSPREASRPDRLSVVVDIQFKAYSPFWRDALLRSLTLATDGGFQFPLAHPWESIANDVEQGVDNKGTVSCPIEVRIYGDCTNPRVINTTYGETLAYIGQIAAGDHVRITTHYGSKKATYVTAAGAESNAMANMDLADSTFWQLRSGLNNVRFEADLNPSGSASIRYRQQYGGI